MPFRPCLDCRALTPTTRCPTHTRQAEAKRTAAKRQRRPERTWAERQRRTQVVQAWRAHHGDWCPGWRTPPHTVQPPNILTADHVVSVAVSSDEHGELTVLCRDCNGRKADS